MYETPFFILYFTDGIRVLLHIRLVFGYAFMINPSASFPYTSQEEKSFSALALLFTQVHLHSLSFEAPTANPQSYASQL